MNTQRIVFTDTASTDTVSTVLAEFCRDRDITRVVTISDSNTFAIAGDDITGALHAAGLTAQAIVLDNTDLIADERSITSVLVDMDPRTQALVAVGSGTITDITRFVSHRTQKQFLSVPTAPSVDGYSSSGAPLVLQGFKQSIRCHAPAVIVASLPILAAAPGEMIAAGVGDVLGKITALADWELASVLVEDRFDREIAEETLQAYRSVVDNIEGIARREPGAIRLLFQALSDTGEAIRRFGGSEPASGSEHFISHFLEMRHLVERKPALLHGAKVALGTIVSAGWYKRLRSWSKDEVAALPLDAPDHRADAREIRRILGAPGELILERNTFLATLNRERVHEIRSRLLDNWDRVQEIARGVPDPEELSALLKTLSGPRTAVDLGLTEEELAQAARLSHYVRSRFVISTLFFALGISRARNVESS